MDKMVIFSPGPGNISERVRRALALPDISHRDGEFTELLGEIKSYTLKVCGVGEGHKSVIFTGSGTTAIEGTIGSLVGVIDTLLIVSNGVYGSRAAEIGKTFGLKVRELEFPLNELPDLEVIEKNLKLPEIGAVYVVHHETTTGLMNPLKEIAKFAKENGKFVLVDGISSICGEELVLDWGVDLIIGSACKCIRGVPGASFVVARNEFLDVIKGRNKRTYYSDLLTHLEKEEEEGETPFTPAVQVFYAFREALMETLHEGVEKRIGHYKNISSQLRTGLKDADLKLLLPEDISSNTMTSVYLPSGFTFKQIHSRLKRDGYIIYNSWGELGGITFRLGTVGLIGPEDIDGFLEAIEKLVDGSR